MSSPQQPGRQKSPPFIIWTLRRTGGTNFAQALFDRSPHSGVQHEPFNQDRLYGQVTHRWLAHRDEKALREELARICAQKVLMKHCVETLPIEINFALADIATQAGYQHVFLYRRRPLGRLLSLYFAKISGIWGKSQAKGAAVPDEVFAKPIPVKELVGHEKHCRKVLTDLFDTLRASHCVPKTIAFEDIYSNTKPGQAEALLSQLLGRLCLSRPDEDAALFDKLLGNGEQGTRSSYGRFVNYSKFAKAVATLGGFDLIPTQTDQPSVSLKPLPAYQPGNARIATTDRQETEQTDAKVGADHHLPLQSGTGNAHPGLFPLVRRRFDDHCPAVEQLWLDDQPANLSPVQAVQLGGALLLKSGLAVQDWQLLASNASGEQPVHWGTPSPKMGRLYPDREQAGNARFEVRGLSIDTDQPVQLLLQSHSGKRWSLVCIEVGN